MGLQKVGAVGEIIIGKPKLHHFAIATELFSLPKLSIVTNQENK